MADLRPLPPGSRIGILGGGQLGRMLILAASRLGMHCHVYSDTDDMSAADVAAHTVIGGYTDLDRLAAFAAGVDVITYEFENVPVDAARHIETLRPVWPPPRALEVAQDRLHEKTFIADLAIPVASFRALAATGAPDEDETRDLLPGILKTRRFGYDGKGQAPVAGHAELLARLGDFGGSPLILEKRISFGLEVSALVVRAADGAVRFYDVPRNEHGGGILRRSTVTGGIIPEAHEAEARRIAARIAEALDYVGVLAVEMFYLGEGATPLIVNEIAPRVHNTGHWTMDGAATDQFENHIRAICNWPLGPTTRHADIEMVNLIGRDVEAWQDYAAQPDCRVHFYGKREARNGRKMAHVNRILRRCVS